MSLEVDDNADFGVASEISLEHEGGYVNDPRDPGGETKYGISKRAYPHEDIANLTIERATSLYRRDYWFPLRLDSIISQGFANNVFDFGIHHGVRGTAKKWQLVLARHFGFKGKIDGLIGGATIAFTNGLLGDPFNDLDLNAKFTRARIEFYTAYAKPIFLKNFVNRAIRYL